MDVDMFLDGYAGWEVGSPHCPIILHEMFQYTMEQGQKEVEKMVHWGCQHSLPKLDPQVGHLCHPISGTLNQQGGVQGLVPQSIQAQEATAVPTLGAGMDGGPG